MLDQIEQLLKNPKRTDFLLLAPIPALILFILFTVCVLYWRFERTADGRTRIPDTDSKFEFQLSTAARETPPLAVVAVAPTEKPTSTPHAHSHTHLHSYPHPNNDTRIGVGLGRTLSTTYNRRTQCPISNGFQLCASEQKHSCVALHKIMGGSFCQRATTNLR